MRAGGGVPRLVSLCTTALLRNDLSRPHNGKMLPSQSPDGGRRASIISRVSVAVVIYAMLRRSHSRFCVWVFLLLVFF